MISRKAVYMETMEICPARSRAFDGSRRGEDSSLLASPCLCDECKSNRHLNLIVALAACFIATWPHF